MGVFDFAMKMEMDGKSFYEQLAEKSTNPGLRTIFSRLAADEQKHYEIFQALQSETPPHMQDTTVLEDARNIFGELLSGKSSVPSFEGDLEGYLYAMKLEADSVDLYEEAAGKEQDASVKDILMRIAGEEQKHFNILENIYNFVNAPNEYLAWREFSNIDEFHQFGRDVDR
jgi:rubrerythrin